MMQTAEMLKAIYDKTVDKGIITTSDQEKVTRLYQQLLSDLNNIQNPATREAVKQNLGLASQVINTLLGPNTVPEPVVQSLKVVTARDEMLEDISRKRELLANRIKTPESEPCCQQVGTLLQELYLEAKHTDEIDMFKDKFTQINENALEPFFKFQDIAQRLQQQIDNPDIEKKEAIVEAKEEFEEDMADEYSDDVSDESAEDMSDEEDVSDQLPMEITESLASGYSNIAHSFDSIGKLEITPVKIAIEDSQGDLIVELMRARLKKDSALDLLFKDITSKEVGIAMSGVSVGATESKSDKNALSSTASALSVFAKSVKHDQVKTLPEPTTPRPEPAAVIVNAAPASTPTGASIEAEEVARARPGMTRSR